MLQIHKKLYEEEGINEIAVIMVRILPCRNCDPG